MSCGSALHGLRSHRSKERRVGKRLVVTSRAVVAAADRSNPLLAGRSNRRCADGQTAPLHLCNRFCSKGKAVLQPVTTSKLPGALPLPPSDKSTHPKGKAVLQPVTTSKLPVALPSPHTNKCSQAKGKAGLQNVPLQNFKVPFLRRQNTSPIIPRARGVLRT